MPFPRGVPQFGQMLFRSETLSGHYERMAMTRHEDHDEIRALQANLKLALDRWDATDRDGQELARLAPVVNELVNAQRELLRRRTQTRGIWLRRLGGWVSVALAVTLLGVLVFAGWSLGWLVLLVLALAGGIYLLATGGTHAQARR